MKYIHNKNSFVKSALAPGGDIPANLKWSQYNLFVDTDDGCLVWNTLTSVLVLLEGVSRGKAIENPNTLPDRDELYSASFLVPIDMDEAERLTQFESIISLVRKPVKKNTYTIFTTLACNARCPYCFEAGAKHTTMTEQTAYDIVDFIDRTRISDRVNFVWFGGEPLLNTRVIDIITSSMADRGIEYRGMMISNGYLFTDDMAEKAWKKWHTTKVQITLDGTEEIYNRTKNYIGIKDSAYQRVLDNIDLLTEHKINVTIRLNISPDNYEDMLVLIDELSERYGDNKDVHVYTHLLFDLMNDDNADECEKLSDIFRVINKKLMEKELAAPSVLPVNLRRNHCCADSDSAFTILPDGKLGKCEHYTDKYFVGDIHSGATDTDMIAQFKKRERHAGRCEKCVFAPSCTMLEKCNIDCTPVYLKTEETKLKNSMTSAYNAYLQKGEDKQ